MTQPNKTTDYDVAPDEATDIIQSYDGPVLVDLDETLYLQNSTEDFIDTAFPRLPALLLMRALDVIKPWRWTGGEATRDNWRVRLVSILFPWTKRRWKNRVAELAKTQTNQSLMEALSKRIASGDKTKDAMPIIATTGFESIVTPLVEAMGLRQSRIVASRLSKLDDKRLGKLHRVNDVLGEEIVKQSLVLTDSIDDLELLHVCAKPLRTIWPEAFYRRALCDVYLPGQYMTIVKRPNERYIIRGILQEDFAFWVLSSVALATLPIFHIAGLVFLLLSFWTIYERGYVDNDFIADRYEKDPKLNPAFATSPVATPRLQPWLWASVSGVIAIWLLRWPNTPVPTDYISWLAVLLATYGWFLLYNRLDKSTRIWMFAGLQLARSAAFVAIVPVTLIGAGALIAHTLARWVPYYIYRLGGKDWPETQFYLIRLMFFIVIAVLFGLTQGFSSLLTITALVLLAWNIFRARKELAALLPAIKRLDRAKP